MESSELYINCKIPDLVLNIIWGRGYGGEGRQRKLKENNKSPKEKHKDDQILSNLQSEQKNTKPVRKMISTE